EARTASSFNVGTITDTPTLAPKAALQGGGSDLVYGLFTPTEERAPAVKPLFSWARALNATTRPGTTLAGNFGGIVKVTIAPCPNVPTVQTSRSRGEQNA